MKYFFSIPSIAETTAISIIGELRKNHCFQPANQINDFIRIDLRHYESGNFLAKEHITKYVNPYTRKFLFSAFIIVLQLATLSPA